MAAGGEKIRVLLAKSEIDAHDRGVRYVARKLMEAGFEVIFIRYAIPDDILTAALQEDVDVIGISFSTGTPMLVIPRVLDLLKKQELNDIAVIVGGIIPDAIVPELKDKGVTDVFGPGSDPAGIIDKIKLAVANRPSA
ncbi:cobalamin B12-binding domain-containing protein [Thermodesulfobacteriota bacterium]